MATNEKIEAILQNHQRWLASAKTAGQRADFSGAQLDGYDFSNSDLSAALFRGASLNGANLQDAQLVHADFSDASLVGARLSGTNLLLSDFTGADLRKADLSSARAASDHDLGQTRRGPRFKDADLQEANLSQTYAYLSDFSGANLAKAKLHGALLAQANLAENNLSGINLSAANLTNANLQGSNFSNTNLTNTLLINANLKHSQLSHADISGANLQSANLANAKVDGILYNRKTKFRGIRVFSCYGSSRFKRFAQDQDYIEEFKEAHPFSYYVWAGLTDCGRSITRVVLWSLALVLVFGLVYFVIGEQAFALTNRETLQWNLFTTTYYSVVTFTTLGFGDITPRTPLAAGFVMLEVIVGYLMLGILISILATKVARRS
jgi:uncharacterized protein YjbI with pentapeptide repeats